MTARISMALLDDIYDPLLTESHAKRFLGSRGFVESSIKPITMCLIPESARKALKERPSPDLAPI